MTVSVQQRARSYPFRRCLCSDLGEASVSFVTTRRFGPANGSSQTPPFGIDPVFFLSVGGQLHLLESVCRTVPVFEDRQRISASKPYFEAHSTNRLVQSGLVLESRCSLARGSPALLPSLLHHAID